MVWAWVFGSLVLVYAFLVGLAFLVRRKAPRRCHEAFTRGEDHRAISIAWAWLNEREIEEAIFRHGPSRLFDIQALSRPRPKKFFRPDVVLALAVILLYQTVLRGGGPFGSGYCPAVPNCSNFYVGCLRRYGFWEAAARGYLRIINCDATRPIAFSEDFRPFHHSSGGLGADVQP